MMKTRVQHYIIIKSRVNHYFLKFAKKVKKNKMNNASLSLRTRRAIKVQIRGSIGADSKIFFLLLDETISCDPSLQPSWQDVSNEGSQDVFYGEIWKIIPNNLCYLLIWSSVIVGFDVKLVAR